MPLLLTLLVACLAAACAGGADENPLASGCANGGCFDLDELDELDDRIDEPIAPDTGLGGEDAPDASEVVEAALVDVDAFWERTYEDLYGDDYEPISGEIGRASCRERVCQYV